MGMRWDETWHRLREWTNGQAPSERLAAQILLAEGFADLDPSHPLGGPDGGRDAVAHRDGFVWIMSVYFPRGQQSFATIKQKFMADFCGVRRTGAMGMVFVTNQELTLGQRVELDTSVDGVTEIYHLERVAAVLDQPRMADTRRQFLAIDTHPVNESSYISVWRVSPESPGIAEIHGRDRERAELAEFLRSGSLTTVTGVITGMAGAGKTALAGRVAADAAAQGWFPGGVLQVDFGENQVEVHQVFASVLFALDESAEGTSAGQLGIKYHDTLRALARAGSRVLLVLDNVTDPARVLPLIPRESPHRVLVTARMVLGPRMDAAIDIRLGALSPEHSVELLVRKSNARKTNALDDLAALCGGLPLALRIVAAIIKAEPHAPLEDLVAELSDETTRLSGLKYADLAVASALQLSYSRLDRDSARCFQFLSLHPGKEFAAGAMASLLEATSATARQLVRNLVHASLVEPGSSTGRWRVHDLVRLYSAQCREAELGPDDLLTAKNRLVSYYFDLVIRASNWLDDTPPSDESPGQLQFHNHSGALAWFRDEIDNLVPSVYQAFGSGQYAEAWDLGMAMGKYLSLRWDYSAALPLIKIALSAAGELNDLEMEMGAVNSLGLTLISLGDHDEAMRTFRAGISRSREAGNTQAQAQLLTGLGDLLRRKGDPVASLQPLRRAVKLAERDQTARSLGFYLTNLGMSLREAGQMTEAVEVLRRALSVHRGTGVRRAEAATMAQLGTALFQTGDDQEAEVLLRGAIDIAADVGDLNNRAMMLMNLANIYRIRSEPAAALRLYNEARVVFQEHRDHANEIKVLTNIVNYCRELGWNREAKEAAQRLRDVAR